jgi:N-acetylglutamate synthase-like GNAT family acetyltransferase
MHFRVSRDGFEISCDPARLDLDVVHGYLTRSYWSPGIPRETVERAARNSMVFGLYESGSGKQVGFARVITDKATFAYLSDVFVLEEWRGRGLSKWLVESILAHPELQGLRRFCLLTRDAQGLYQRYGFTGLPDAATYMERRDPDVYTRGRA